MSKFLFIAYCEAYNVEPSIALENKAVAAAVKAKSLTELQDALETQF